MAANARPAPVCPHHQDHHHTLGDPEMPGAAGAETACNRAARLSSGWNSAAAWPLGA